MIKETIVETEKRTDIGKNASRRLRRLGKIPAVLYGGKDSAMPLVVDPKSLEEILHSEAGANTLFGLRVGSASVPGRVMIKEYTTDPVTDALTHADFMRIAMDKAIRVQVALHAVGIARGVKLQGGILDHPMREVEVECLPVNIPERIDVDIAELDLGKSIRVSDLKVPAGVKILTDPAKPVIAVVAPTIEKVAAPAAEGAVVAEAPTEPEVIKKGKAETAEEGEAPAEKKSAEKKPAEKKPAEKGGKAEKK